MLVLLEMTCATQLLYRIPWPAHPSALSPVFTENERSVSRKKDDNISALYRPDEMVAKVRKHSLTTTFSLLTNLDTHFLRDMRNKHYLSSDRPCSYKVV